MIQATTKYVPSALATHCRIVDDALANDSQVVGLNLIAELVVGYALPGRPAAMMMFKTWGFIAMTQGLALTSDFKLGHYMKIPP